MEFERLIMKLVTSFVLRLLAIHSLFLSTNASGRIAKNKKMQRPGIEPGPPAWQARILPLNQRCSCGYPWNKHTRFLDVDFWFSFIF